MELINEIYEKIEKYSKLGDRYFEEGKYKLAIREYLNGLDIVPYPKEDWEASTWLNTALGDSYFMNGNYIEAKHYLYEALNSPNGLTNAFIFLRLGQTLEELKEERKAREYLLRAYILEGEKIFENEDIKYFNVIKDVI